MSMPDRAREEFFSEAQETIDRLARDLLAIDGASHPSAASPERLSSLFRSVHTLKGLCGMFNAPRLGALSHELENVLDDVRHGRLTLSPVLCDLLFQAIELYQALLASEQNGDRDWVQVPLESFVQRLRKISHPDSPQRLAPLPEQLGASVLSVLTEYEEHRLRCCLEQGLGLYRICFRFALSQIETELEAVKAKLKDHGEILTFLPTGDGPSSESIELAVLLASSEAADQLADTLAPLSAKLEQLSQPPPQTRTLLPPGHDRNNGPATMRPFHQESVAATVRPPALTIGLAHSQAAAGERLVLRPEVSLRSVAQTVRVPIHKLDSLMSLLGELTIVRGALARLTDKLRQDPEQRPLAKELGRLHHAFERHLAAMQTGILEVRLVPLGQVFERLARVTRQLSHELDKPVNLVLTGAETEVDKLIGEELSDPLMHMIRNALDHGIEPHAQRLAMGKPEVATIALNAYPKGNQVVVEIEDDGAGIDPEQLVQAALRSGALALEDTRDLSQREALALVFVQGITTRTDPSSLSGRGVGLDIVKTNISKLGGVVDVQSELGIGTKFTITLPVTLAIIGALMIQVAGQTYAVPLGGVTEALWVDAASVRFVEGRDLATVRGETLVLCRLDALLGLSPTPSDSDTARRLMIVVVTVASRRCGLVVDAILGRQDIIIKALSGPLRNVRGFVGATELGDERVALVLDVPTLLEEALAYPTGPRLLGVQGNG